MFSKQLTWAMMGLILSAQSGCAEMRSMAQDSSWHEKFEWKAEDYFDDPQVIALCRAIEANDIAEIDRLVAAGADVNAQGKGKMTPLLWAFPDNKLARFKCLLKHGADPNIIVMSDFGTRGAIMSGESVTHMASETAFTGYFEAVFNANGNPNLQKETTALGKGETPLFGVIKSSSGNKQKRLQLLIEKGADVNRLSASGTTPVMLATGWGGQYDIAVLLLDAGADLRTYKPKSNTRLIHIVLAEERRSETWTSKQRADYRALLNWLVAQGESVDEAKADRERWKSWSQTTGEYRRNMDAEIAERKKRGFFRKFSG